MRRLLIALAVLVAGNAHAGDPCPISFTFYDLGAPEWLDRAALLDALESKDSWIGISFKSGDGGVKITNVSDGSPAQKSGLQRGDIVTEAGGQPLSTHQAFGQQLRDTAPGATLALKVKRADKVLDVPLTLGRQDPVFGAIVDYASKQECTSVSRGDITEEARKAVLKLMFSKGRRFRCDDAHDALSEAKINGWQYSAGDIFVVRGSKRLLLANTGWATTCIRAKSHDGAKLTEKAIGKVFKKLSKAYIAEMYANP